MVADACSGRQRRGDARMERIAGVLHGRDVVGLGLDAHGDQARGARLIDAQLTRADLRGAILGPLEIGQGRFIRADLSRANFVNAQLKSANLTGATLDATRGLEGFI